MIGKTPGGSGLRRRINGERRDRRDRRDRRRPPAGHRRHDEARAQEPVVGAASADAAAEQIVVEGARPQFSDLRA